MPPELTRYTKSGKFDIAPHPGGSSPFNDWHISQHILRH